MDPHKLYECENTIGTKTTYQKGSADIDNKYEGICKGQAVVWCANMLRGVAPKLTKPSYDRAAALQVLYERSADGGSQSMFAKASLSVAANPQGNGQALLGQIIGTPGVYQIRYTGHALAAANVGGKYYFFDSEQGLFEYDSALDFTVKFFGGYNSNNYHEMWQLQAG